MPVTHGASLGLKVWWSPWVLIINRRTMVNVLCVVLNLHLLIRIHRWDGTDFERWWLCRIFPSERFVYSHSFILAIGLEKIIIRQPCAITWFRRLSIQEECFPKSPGSDHHSKSWRDLPWDYGRRRIFCASMRWWSRVSLHAPIHIFWLFYMIAGIWDCLTSQNVVDFVRYQVSKGKELTEIGEMMCDHCLAPDTDSELFGCDNMTVVIVAITHGRSKKEWYKWIADRVRNHYGYKTPSDLPELYTQSRLMAFQKQKEIYDREKNAAQRNASTSAQSARSPTQARSQNDSLAGSKSNAISWGSILWQPGWSSLLSRVIAVISGWLGRKSKKWP